MRSSIVVVLCLSCGCSSGAPGAVREPRVEAPAVPSPAGAKLRAAVPPSTLDADGHALTELRRARGLFATFIEKAGSDPRYADAVTRAKERIADLDATIPFLEEGRKQRMGASGAALP